MTIVLNNYNSTIPNVFLPFCQNDLKKNKKGFRYHNKTNSDSFTKTKALAGASLGALATVAAMAKIQKVKPWNVAYELGEIVSLSAGAITGGILAGSIGASKEDKKEKCVEGLFQFLNTLIPAFLVDKGLKLISKSSQYNTGLIKGAASVVGVLMGMQLASTATNIITDPKNKIADRKLSIKDAIANIDDAIGVLVLIRANSKCKKSAFIDNLQIERVLPAIAAWCGYRAGQTN